MSLHAARLAVALLLAAPLAATAAEPTPATVAVTFDAHRILSARQEGAADRATARPATADDPVRIASISKLVTALGVMRLVEDGRLDLDRDVSDYLGYPVRNPAFPDAPVTLRLLLSHRASLTDDADYLIPLGDTVRARLADPRAWDAHHAPGSDWFHYANLNFPVVASVMEAATGERFDALMLRLVLRPLRLRACYNWSGCDAATVARAVVLYRADGSVARDNLHGVLPPCLVLPATDGTCDLAHYVPGWNGGLFSPQGGLRVSMRDLARIGQVLARRGRPLLSAHSFAELERTAWRFDGSNGLGENGKADGFFCTYGLALHRIATGGPGCHDDPFGDGVERIGHAGEAYGLRSGLWVDPASGKGVAFFTTAVPDDAPHGTSAFTAAEEAVIRWHKP